ncbi:hypothetical protein BKA70DRAFT_1061648, partial [Coprinopsis sp. MPI-PUGE-AT-0042]
NAKTTSRIATEINWFSPMLRDNVDRINSLPIDHHLFAALIAPRGLFVVERWRILWLGPQTAFGCQ